MPDSGGPAQLHDSRLDTFAQATILSLDLTYTSLPFVPPQLTANNRLSGASTLPIPPSIAHLNDSHESGRGTTQLEYSDAGGRESTYTSSYAHLRPSRGLELIQKGGR